ncbi:threonine and homoserine efflux system [Pseudomonas sp. 8Z]|uniref:threonine/homoserine exporter RhtA n=1 Tax=Pseudomonas sp. 8Z TaxID=2653166 RepID=UPI0012EFDC43|nr:threonine/homoserine exporter RhtA [Pseudomonas sp. 8Z]VXD02047.1 threonine and homoserine efflux system [Pseudomonas sp. 8Z]
MSRSTLLAPVALLVVAMVSIQSGASLAKQLFPVLGAEGTTTLRLVLSAIILSLVMQPWRAKLDLRKCRALIAYGLALGCMNLLFYMSLQHIALGIAVALEFTGPLTLALLSSRRPLDFLWVILAITGLWMLLPTDATQNAIDPLGAALALGAGACWSLYIIFGQKAGAEHGRHTVALGTWVAVLLVLPIGIWHTGSNLLNIDLLPIALAVAVLSSALPYSLEMIALTRLPARTFSILMSLEPAVAALCGLIFLGERLLWGQWLAVGAIIIASVGAAATIKPKS